MRKSHTRSRPQKKARSHPRKSPAFPYKESFSSASSQGRIVPDQFDTQLTYAVASTLINAASGVMYKEYQPNGAFDVDPALGSTETPGFDEMAKLYDYYRVFGIKYVISVTNLEAFAVDSYVINSGVAPSGVSSNFLMMATQPYNKWVQLAPKGSPGCSHTFRGTLWYSRLLGSKVVETEDNYRALVTAVPSDLFWLTVAAEANGAFLLANGVQYTAYITMFTRFYSRQLDLSLASATEKLNRSSERLAKYQAARDLLQMSKKAKISGLKN